jgi:hypothetical protein
MPRFCAKRGRALLPLVLSIAWAGCSRPGTSSESAPMGQQVPFRGAGESAAGTDPIGAPQPAIPTSSSSAPFRDNQNLPAGTMLTVRLKLPIASSRGAEPSNTFTAEVDDAVVIDGVTLIPRGAGVGGHFESPRFPKSRRGLIRLNLTSINVGGQDLPVETSILFARGETSKTGGANPNESNVITLEKGHRLTFRLAEPLDIGEQLAKSGS